MLLRLRKNQINREYKVKFSEKINPVEAEEILIKAEMDFDITTEKDEVIFFLKSKLPHSGGEIGSILDQANESFDVIGYKINMSGKIIGLTNYIEILDKWKTIKKNITSKGDNKNIKNFVFDFNGIMDKKESVVNLLKKYSIFPYIFIGLYNKEISSGIIDGVLTNLYPLEDIPVSYEIKDVSGESGKKLVFSGKDKTEFDRFSYLKKLREDLNIKDTVRSSVEVKFEGYFKFHEDDTLKEYEINIKIKAHNLLEYTCKYYISERGSINED